MFAIEEIVSNSKVLVRAPPKRASRSPPSARPVQTAATATTTADQALDLENMLNARSAAGVAAALHTGDKVIMEKTLQLLAQRTNQPRAVHTTSSTERSRDATPLRQQANSRSKKKPDLSRGIINMHIAKVHKPSPHVLRRANFTGGGFKAHNEPWWQSEEMADYLYEEGTASSAQHMLPFEVPQSFTHAPAKCLEQLTHLPSDAAKVLSSSAEQHRKNLKAFKPLLLFAGGGASTDRRGGESRDFNIVAKSLRFEKKKAAK